jgi:hypothetical protein
MPPSKTGWPSLNVVIFPHFFFLVGLRTYQYPVLPYKVSESEKTTGWTVQVSDPGRARDFSATSKNPDRLWSSNNWYRYSFQG